MAVEPATEMAESSRPETAEEPARIAELPIQTAQSNSTIQLNSVDNLLNAKSRVRLFGAWHKGRQLALGSTSLSQAEKKALVVPGHYVSLSDVVQISNFVDAHLKSKTTYRVIERIRPYVHGLEQYGKALSTYANGSPLVMAPLWGSTQILITLAANFIDAFDQVLDMLQDISENLPRFERYASVFRGRAMFQAALSLLYSDIAEFLTSTIEFFCRRGISVLWRSLWKPLKEDFNRIIGQLKKHILFVDKEATVTGFEHNQEKLEQAFTNLENIVANSLRYSERVVNEQRRTQEIMNALQLREVTRWLSADSPQMRYEAALQRVHPSTGAWLLSLHEFHAWLAAPKNQVLPILWIHGAPGCGKTLLAAKIIQFLYNQMKNKKQQDEKFVLAYFFCDFNDATKRSCLAVASSIVSQLLAADPNLFPHAVASMNESGESKATSSTRLFTLAKDLLTTFASTFILVDAIDECSTEERRLILDHLNDLSRSNTTTKIMILSRREPDIKKIIGSYPSYAISPMDTSPDITQYVSTCLHEENNFKFSIKRPLRMEIEQKLSKAAQGNFLWVRLMVETLRAQPFEDYEQLKDAVTNLPLGLGSAYGRVLYNSCINQNSFKKLPF